MDLARFGRIVYDRRTELGITQEEVDKNGGPTDTTLGKIENGEWVPGNRKDTLRKLDVGLSWEPGSAKRALDGGDPVPLPSVRDQWKLPDLPRGVPFGPALSGLDHALGIHSRIPDQHLPMPASERQLLVSARNKLLHFDRDPPALTEEELAVLKQFLEDDELRTLHTRIDWLPRAEQLKVSALVTELAAAIEQRWVEDGYDNESEHLPDYARPNPLPVLGYAPNAEDFPVRVPTFTQKEKNDDLETPKKSDASSKASKVKEAWLRSDELKERPGEVINSIKSPEESAVDRGHDGKDGHGLRRGEV